MWVPKSNPQLDYAILYIYSKSWKFTIIGFWQQLTRYTGFRRSFPINLSILQNSTNTMTSTSLSSTELKKLVGYKAVDDYVKSGMVIGLGTGSTACWAVERLGQLLTSGELIDIICVPTSEATRVQAQSLNIPLCTLNELQPKTPHGYSIDVTIDGADEIDVHRCLIKGGGGALLREKMVEMATNLFICIVDDTKLSPVLGSKFALPVEITPFCHEHTCRAIAALPSIATCGGKLTVRMGYASNAMKKDPNDPMMAKIALSDNNNYIVDIYFNKDSACIIDPVLTSAELKSIVGVVEHGIFHSQCQPAIVIIACAAGGNIRVVGGEHGEEPWWGA